MLGEDVTEELEYVPGRFVVKRIVRPRLACTCCEVIHQSPLPSRPIEKGRPGPGLVAHVVISKYADHLPLYRQSQIFAREGTNVARLDIKPAQGEMEPSEVEISATSEETGKNETIVEATVDGTGVLIAFNVKYMREALEVIKTPNVALETSAANAPGVIRPVGEDDFLHVIMPMHLG